ncbi:MAG: lamin tail domain-containing protein [Flavobacteriales bacterium]|nr:lamin tail domain-containing protein [Flavobacteriales bacterium]
MNYLCLLLLCASGAIAQISDDFSDGDFKQNPRWFGMQNNFEIDPEYRLHLNAPGENSSSYLALKSRVLENASWEMSLKLDFNPSSSNYLDWYVMANDTLLENCSKAYFVRIGNSEDEVSLYRQKNGEITKIIDGLDGRVNMTPVEINLKVERLSGGHWALWIDLLDENGWILEGSIQDHQINDTQYSGVNCVYTSTRSNKFYFDDFFISGNPFIDSIPPVLVVAEIRNENLIRLEFESDDLSEIYEAQFEILPSNIYPNNSSKNGSQIQLLFENALPLNQEFQLKISAVTDTSGNLLNDTILDFYVQKHRRFDLIINEIMIDSEPVVQLPNAEYIELYNRANYPLTLEGWKLKINDHLREIPTILLESNEYLILIDKEDSLLFEEFPFQCLDFWPNLNNTEAYVGLFDENNRIVHEVQYHKSWYQNTNKENGGWSLEIIDPENYCSGKNNWIACKNSFGGSPGFVNSVNQENPDTTAPFIKKIEVLENNKIQITWSENLYDSTLYFFDSYVFSNGMTPSSINHSMDKTDIQFFDDLEEGVLYGISVHNIEDCQRNRMEQIYSEFVQGIWPEKGSVYLNEILFNPKTDGYDYVELYNVSDEYIDLSKLIIGNYDSLLNDITNTEIISEKHLNFPPNSYLALCEDTNWIKSNYVSNDSLFFFEINRLPSMPNEKGSVAISSLAYEIIDVSSYHEDAHFPLLEDVEGVALERLNITSDKWFSASSRENYGTPARQNSQFVYEHRSNSQLEITPEIFSPDNDGIQDFANITIQVEKPAKASVHIYDKKGFVVREVCESKLITANAHWVWNGLDEENLKLPIGIYMAVVALIEAGGKQELLKHPVVIR